VTVATKTDSVDGGSASPSTRRASDVVDAAAAVTADTLPERFARGEAAAFDELVRRYHPAVARLARRLLGWSSDAEDVVQEVFLAALKNATRYRKQSTLETWLTTITLNKCRSHRRGLLSRLRLLAGLGARPVDPSPPADVPAAEADSFRRVQAALQRLSPREREVIVLHYLEQKSAAEIATLLGVRRGAAEVRLSRARTRLREIVGVDVVAAEAR
jgi:RNA polymerase sigma-70 factor (ECF subfamily)